MRAETRTITSAVNEEWSHYYRDHRLPGIEVLHAHFVRHRYPRHFHEYPVVAVVERGAASFWCRGPQHTAVRGQVFVINAGEAHTGEPAVADGYVYSALYPQLDYLEQLAQDIGSGTGAVCFTGTLLDDNLLSSLLAKFHARMTKHAPAAETESALLNVLARLITRHSASQPVCRKAGMERPAVRLAKDFMESHFDEDVSVSVLAKACSLNPFHFARVFERAVGLPPHAYLESVRIRKVREFLDRGYSIVSAALSAGFVDQSYLTHRFKRILGITPGQYAREHARFNKVTQPISAELDSQADSGGRQSMAALVSRFASCISLVSE